MNYSTCEGPVTGEQAVPKSPFSTYQETIDYAEEHLYYEVFMLTGVLRIYTDQGSLMGNTFLENTTLEAFGHHLRNLIDFLYPDYYKAKKDDVVSDHFLTEEKVAEWRAKRGTLSCAMNRARERINKEMAHLTKKRKQSTPEKDWRNIVELTGQVGKALDSFLQILGATPAILRLRESVDELNRLALIAQPQGEAGYTTGTTKSLTSRQQHS